MVILLSSMACGELLLEVTLLFFHRVVLLHILIFHFRLSCNILSIRHLLVFGQIVILLGTVPVGFFSVAELNDLHFLGLSGEFEVDFAQVLQLLNVEHSLGAKPEHHHEALASDHLGVFRGWKKFLKGDVLDISGGFGLKHVGLVL